MSESAAAGLTGPYADCGTSPRAYEVSRAIIVANKLINREDLVVLMRLCERCTPGDLDSYVNKVGVHSVMKMWDDRLHMAPSNCHCVLHGQGMPGPPEVGLVD